jgi:riboflavin kinase / FMN adenylyltransferase
VDIFSDAEPAPAHARGSALALGNFDGVHKGHQAVIGAAARIARERGAPLGAAVFEPNPRQLLRPDDPPFRLQSPRQRANALAAVGVNALFEIPFNRELASLSDADFARVILSERLGVTHVAIGFDFKFGARRMGDADSLTRFGKELGFTVGVVEPVSEGALAKVSSTSIRDAIAIGRMEDAAHWLTRPFAIEGMVLPGFQRGRTIGFPTANVGLGSYVQPRFGVYAVRARLEDGSLRPGVANVGVKPTVPGKHEPLLESFLFDFSDDLYGRRIEVELHNFLRPEEKFASFEEMTVQIAADADQARKLLA